MKLLHNLWQRLAVRQFVKYVIVGCVVTAIDMVVLHVLYKWAHLPIKLSVIAGFMCGNVSSFVFNKYYTFRNFSTAIIRQYAKYFVTSMSGLLWTLVLMTLFYEHWNLFAGISSNNYLLCKAVVAVLVMFWNFVIIRNWTLASYEFPSLCNPNKPTNALYLSVIIPAYNEQNRLPETLRTVTAWLEKQAYSWELIVVDDGSNDDTVAVFNRDYAHHPQVRLHSFDHNQGKGAAVRTGMLLAQGQYRLFMDADQQIKITELEHFLPHADPCTVIIGSKYLHASQAEIQQRISFSRRLVSRIGNLLIRLILEIQVQDTQCGFKLFPGHVADEVFRLQRLSGFAFDVEILTLSKLLKVKIVEMPIKLHDNADTRVQTWRDSLRVFSDLLRIKMNIWGRKYSPNSQTAKVQMKPSE